MQVIAAHCGVTQEGFIFSCDNKSRRAVSRALRGPDSFRVSQLSLPEGLPFFFMVAPLPGIASVFKTARRRPEAEASSSVAPLTPITCAGSPSLRPATNVSLNRSRSQATRHLEEPGKDSWFRSHTWMPETKAGLCGKEKETGYGQDGEN